MADVQAEARGLTARVSGGWLVSRRVDLLWIALPAWLAVVVAVSLPRGAAVGPWAWLVLVVGIDVAHVYATLFRTYLQPGEVARRPALYLGVPAACLAALLAVHALAPGWLWTVLAYVAVWHFVRQAVGIGALYRARDGLPGGTWDARLERGALYAVTVAPVVWWHAHLPRAFTWFTADDFFTGLPAWAVTPVAAAAGAVVLAHVGVRVASRRARPGADLWLATTAGVWVGGIVLSDSDLGFTITNVVAHGLPYAVLVGAASRGRWATSGDGPGRAGWFTGAGVAVAVAIPVGLALVEEGLWDALVWHDHEVLFGAWSAAPAIAWIAVPVLALPQVAHYALDGWIWRLRPGENPGLARALGLSSPRGAPHDAPS